MDSWMEGWIREVKLESLGGIWSLAGGMKVNRKLRVRMFWMGEWMNLHGSDWEFSTNPG